MARSSGGWKVRQAFRPADCPCSKRCSPCTGSIGFLFRTPRPWWKAFLEAAGVVLIPLAEAETREAIGAYARYGKGQGHPAQLNLGDCFSYACARTQGVPLLFIGNDFSRTDIPSALA